MTQADHNLEIEVKFHLSDPVRTREHLDRIGAAAQPKVFETNVRFEDDTGSLKKTNRLLRLRRDSSCRLTFKCPPNKIDTQCKVYRELEVEVSDFETMSAMLNNMGYHEVQIYEKWRQTFTWRNVLICMDTMPYGDFMEIEGPEQGIREAAQTLDMQWAKRILTNYLGMFETLRNDNEWSFNDVTFDHFKQHPVDITAYLPQFQANDQSIP